MDVITRIRTSRPTAPREIHDHNGPVRLIARVIRDIQRTQQFETFADFVPELRQRLEALRVRYRPCDFDQAIVLVASNARLIQEPAARRVQAPQERRAPAIGRQEASVLLASVAARTGCPLPIRGIR